MIFESWYRLLVVLPLALIGVCFLLCAISQSLRDAIAEWWFR